MQLTQPTPIQKQAIPLAMDGHDVLGLAQTGTGKTMAFGLPLLERLGAEGGKAAAKTARGLILAPTRELVNQISESLKPLGISTNLRISRVVGGQSIGKQIQMMQRGTDVLVATPGRLIDLMKRRAIDLSKTRYLVLDEADQMLDLGFIHALRQIAPRLGTPRQTMLFSATMSDQMEELSREFLQDPQRIQVASPGKAADKIEQSIHYLDREQKPEKLRDILAQDLEALTLVFARTKHGAEKLMKSLVADGFSATSIHGNKSQGQRDRAIKEFKSGKAKILVATDVAARGIDIPNVAYVINFELPEAPENYIHRIGRTARAGREGQAISLCAPHEAKLIRQIEKLMKIQVPVASGSVETLKEAGGSARKDGSKKRKRFKGNARTKTDFKPRTDAKQRNGANSGRGSKPKSATKPSRKSRKQRKAQHRQAA